MCQNFNLKMLIMRKLQLFTIVCFFSFLLYSGSSFSQITPNRGRYSSFNLFSFSFEGRMGLFPKRPYIYVCKSGNNITLNLKNNVYQKYFLCDIIGDSIVELNTRVQSGGKGYTDNVVVYRNLNNAIHCKSLYKSESNKTVMLYSKQDSLLRIDFFHISMSDENYLGIKKENLSSFNGYANLGFIKCRIDSANTVFIQECKLSAGDFCPQCEKLKQYCDGRNFEFYLFLYLVEFPWFK
ncbi:hypothetical protein SDC9_74146 [bioreactor metagenome]|uniref:Uncharacterized protein n=1 Tax=bioreactor metagenome TaxID=1076179 RepID=A0A644YMB8_9ZZZZ